MLTAKNSVLFRNSRSPQNPIKNCVRISIFMINFPEYLHVELSFPPNLQPQRNPS